MADFIHFLASQGRRRGNKGIAVFTMRKKNKEVNAGGWSMAYVMKTSPLTLGEGKKRISYKPDVYGHL